MVRKFIACTILILAPATMQAKTLPPKQECHGLADFAPTRAAFEKAVASRDRDSLLALINPGIELDFGGGAGRDEFVKRWQLNSRKTRFASPIWTELDKIVKLGCAVDDNMVAYPHMFWRIRGLDGNSPAYLITGTRVNLRKAPHPKAKSLGLLSWEVVDEIAPDPNSAVGWIMVRTDMGLRGYVRQDFVRSDYDYRIIFGKETGAWQISAFIAGD